MNILQICTKVPFPPKDGGSAAIYAISGALAKLGHNVTIFAINPPKHFVDPSKIQFPKGITLKVININTSPSLWEALQNLFFSRKPYHVIRFSTHAVKRKLVPILKKEQFDIIQFEGIYTSDLLQVINKNSTVKISLRAHNIEFKLWKDIAKSTKNPFLRIYLKIQASRLQKFEKQVYKKVDFIIPISAPDLAEISKQTTSRILMIPYCVEVNHQFTVKSFNDKKDICYIGALDWLPNQEGILWFANKICPLLIKNLPDLKIHIAGRNAPEKLKQNLKLYNNIIFHDEIDDADSFIQTYKVMVVPLLTGGGMRIKIIDALKLQTPVICTSKAIEGTDLEHNKHILVANSEDEFLQNISEILINADLSVKIAENGYHYICENYDNLMWTNKLVSFFELNQ